LTPPPKRLGGFALEKSNNKNKNTMKTTKQILTSKKLEALPNAMLIKELVEYGSGKMCPSPCGYLKVLAQNDKAIRKWTQ
jgi:hypothetical protein